MAFSLRSIVGSTLVLSLMVPSLVTVGGMLPVVDSAHASYSSEPSSTPMMCTPQDPRILCVQNMLGLPQAVVGPNLGNTSLVFWDTKRDKQVFFNALAQCGLIRLSAGTSANPVFSDANLKSLVKSVVGQPVMTNASYRQITIDGACSKANFNTYAAAGHQISLDDNCKSGSQGELNYSVNRKNIRRSDTSLAGHPWRYGDLTEGVSDATAYLTLAAICPPVQPKADLAINKYGPATISRGDKIKYELTVVNNGPTAANSVIVTDKFPEGLNYLPGYSNSNCSQYGDSVMCSLGTLAPNSSTSLLLTFGTWNVQGWDRTTVKNFAKVTSSTPDPDLSNNYSKTVATIVDCRGGSSSSYSSYSSSYSSSSWSSSYPSSSSSSSWSSSSSYSSSSSSYSSSSSSYSSSSSSYSNVNLIQNPSMEMNGNGEPLYWNKGGWGSNNAFHDYSNDANDGSKSVSVTMSSYTDGDAKWYFDDVAVTPGVQYQYSDFFKSSGPNAVFVRYKMSNGTYTYAQIGAPGQSSNWMQYTGTFTPPAGTVSATVFHVLQGNGTLTIDNVSLQLLSAIGPGAGAFEKGYVSLRFDDGWMSHLTTVNPMLNAAGLKGSFYIVTNEMFNSAGDTSNMDSYMNATQTKQLYNAGHEVSPHTRTHPSLPGLTNAQQVAEVKGSRDDLLNAGMQPADTFTYPFGDYNANVTQVVKNAGYIGASTTQTGYNTKNTDKFALKVQNVLSTTTVNEIKNWISAAMNNHTWLQVVFHQVDTNGKDYSITPQKLQQVVDHLKANNVPVITVRQGVQMMP